ISRRCYNLIPAESKFKNLVLDHQDKYMMKAQVHVSKSSTISDIQALPQRKHYCQIYQMINFTSGVKCVLNFIPSWFLAKCRHIYVVSSLMDTAYRMSEQISYKNARIPLLIHLVKVFIISNYVARMTRDIFWVKHAVAIASSQKNSGSLEAKSIVRAALTVNVCKFEVSKLHEEESVASVLDGAKGLINSYARNLMCLSGLLEEKLLVIVAHGLSCHNMTPFVVVERGMTRDIFWVKHAVAIASSQKNSGSLEAKSIVRAALTVVQIRHSTTSFCSSVREIFVW
nr:hypothetical protein [Tanacetum cinerariifolium]